jgi:hypothetical protein
MLNSFLKFVAGKWSITTVSEVNPLPVNIVNDNSPVSSSNPLLVQNPNAAPIDRSSSITTGGAAQVAMAALSTRKAYFFKTSLVRSCGEVGLEQPHLAQQVHSPFSQTASFAQLRSVKQLH